MVPLRTAVVIPPVAEAFYEAGNPVNPVADVRPLDRRTRGVSGHRAAGWCIYSRA
jgi:hypothetical protein